MSRIVQREEHNARLFSSPLMRSLCGNDSSVTTEAPLARQAAPLGPQGTLDVRALFAGTVVLIALDALAGADQLIHQYWLLRAFVEAMLFAGIVLYAYRAHGWLRWIAAPVGAGILNMALNYLSVFLLALPMVIERALNLTQAAGEFLAFAYLSALGALLFTALLDIVVRPLHFSGRTYAWTCGLTSLAGIPMAVETYYSLQIHKSLWWVLFGCALVASYALRKEDGQAPGLESVP